MIKNPESPDQKKAKVLASFMIINLCKEKKNWSEFENLQYHLPGPMYGFVPYQTAISRPRGSTFVTESNTDTIIYGTPYEIKQSFTACLNSEKHYQPYAFSLKKISL